MMLGFNPLSREDYPFDISHEVEGDTIRYVITAPKAWAVHLRTALFTLSALGEILQRHYERGQAEISARARVEEHRRLSQEIRHHYEKLRRGGVRHRLAVQMTMDAFPQLPGTDVRLLIRTTPAAPISVD